MRDDDDRKHAGRRNLQLIFINACNSADVAKQLSAYVDFVIGHHNPVGDKNAIVFSRELFGNLGKGENLCSSFRQAEAVSFTKYGLNGPTYEIQGRKNAKKFWLFSLDREDLAQKMQQVHDEAERRRKLSLSILLEKYDLKDETNVLLKQGVKKISDLAYLSNEMINTLQISPLNRVKLNKLIDDRGPSSACMTPLPAASMSEGPLFAALTGGASLSAASMPNVDRKELDDPEMLQGVPEKKLVQLALRLTADATSYSKRPDDSDSDSRKSNASTRRFLSEGSSDGSFSDSDSEEKMTFVMAKNKSDRDDFQENMQGLLLRRLLQTLQKSEGGCGTRVGDL